MSRPVSLDALRQRVAEFGNRAFLVTVTDDHQPHVVSVVTEMHDDLLTMGAGRQTATNAAARPAVTVLWPATNGDYSLIVDGHAVVEAQNELVTIRPSSAILHKTAGAQVDGPTCIAVTDS